MASKKTPQQIEKSGQRASLILLVLLLVFLVVIYDVVWTHFHQTGLWNLFGIIALLLVALIPVTISFFQAQAKIEHEYTQAISDLLLEHKLRTSHPNDEVRRIANVLTLSAFERLGTFSRGAKGRLLQFLYRMELIDAHKPLVSLAKVEAYNASCLYANFAGANFHDAMLLSIKLRGADLSNAVLQGAMLDNANLTNANLEGADLRGASLQEAKLEGAILRNADLTGAQIDNKDLRGAYLGNTIMPDGSVSP